MVFKNDEIKTTANFGDRVSTVDGKGKRKWIYALKPVGKLYNIRTIVSVIYLVLFFGFPFVKLNGTPLFLFNVVDAQFIFFGKIFLPQDFILLGIGMLTMLLFIIVFTLVFGRVFCGWACPQTIFLEMVFRRIEYWIEGNANKQKLADENPTTKYYTRKAFKHIVFFLLSFVIANTFLSYIIGVEELFRIMNEPVTGHLGGFLAILGFTGVFYAVFAFVRDLVCTVICPYGRLQSVLLDKNSIIVAYDYLRGEPRAKIKKADTEEKGDCIDCGLCVQVCPTGIDIRNGTQMECVNCTACIDACNMMMDKVHRAPDLIRFASENNIAKGEKAKFTYRIKAYTAVLVILVGILTTMLITRSMFDSTVLRVPGQILQENPDGTISNLYRIKIVNKNSQIQPYHLSITEQDAKLAFIGKPLDSLKPVMETEETFFIKVPKEKITRRRNNFTIKVMSGNNIIQTQKVSFIGEY